MEPGSTFDMWRDYLGLAAVVAALPLPRPTAAADSNTADDTPRQPPAASPAALGPPPAAPAAPCAFCQHNGEAPAVYSGHSLRDAAGRLLCPVLRGYICPQCGATQDRAHTRRFCPLTRHGYTSVYSSGRRAGARRGGSAKK